MDATIARALVATHHLFDIGGSELVLAEFAEELSARGVVIDLFCSFALPAVVEHLMPFVRDVYTEFRTGRPRPL